MEQFNVELNLNRVTFSYYVISPGISLFVFSKHLDPTLKITPCLIGQEQVDFRTDGIGKNWWIYNSRDHASEWLKDLILKILVWMTVDSGWLEVLVSWELGSEEGDWDLIVGGESGSEGVFPLCRPDLRKTSLSISPQIIYCFRSVYPRYYQFLFLLDSVCYISANLITKTTFK